MNAPLSIRLLTCPNEKADAVKEVLLDLPQWFGLPESTQRYIDESKALPCWAALRQSREYLGFITLQNTSFCTAEIHCMGVKAAYHRLGLGQKLFEEAIAYAKNQGLQYLQVKTVAKGHYKEYDQTIAFYEKMGFLPLEVFPTLWDKHNPCLILVQKI